MDGYDYITVIGLNWKFHKCKFCSFRTRFLCVILRHVKRHGVKRHHRVKLHRQSFDCFFDRPGNYWCEQCRFETDMKVLLMWHFNKVHRKKEIQHYLRPALNCEDCSFQTHSSLVLLRHNCSNISGSNSLQTERSQRDELGYFRCAECRFKTTRKDCLKNHVLWLHTPSEQINWLGKNRGKVCVSNAERSRSFNCYFDSPKKYCCKKCTFRSEFKVLFMVHFNKEHKKKEIKSYLIRPIMNCEDCNFETFSPLVLLRHKCTGSNSSRSRDYQRDELGYFRCHECPFKTKWKDSLKSHFLRLHTPSEQIKWFECERCSYKAKFKGDLKQHIRAMHTSPDEIHWFKCELCSYRTKNKYSLRKHTELEKHQPLKCTGSSCSRIRDYRRADELGQFRCDECPFKTARKDCLKNHVLRLHAPTEQIKWFECERCSYKAKFKGDLKQHIRAMHTSPDEIHWFKCELCAYKTKSKYSLLKHTELEIHKSLKCDHCSFRTTTDKYLRSHLRRRHTEAIDLFKCEYCSYETNLKDDLAQHVLSQHLQPTPLSQPPVPQHLQPSALSQLLQSAVLSPYLQPPVQHLQLPVLPHHLQPPVFSQHLQPPVLPHQLQPPDFENLK